jgi:hypothetical protein
MIRNLIVFGTFALASLTAADFASAQVTTNASQKALAAGSAPFIQRAGYYAPGDGGGALYRWDKTATCTDDGGSCIMPNKASAQGRWILANDGAVSVKVFGAHCDGTTDDTAAFNKALAVTTAVFVPANATCDVILNSASGGIQLNHQNHLYGQNQYTSTIKFHLNFTPSYDWVPGVSPNFTAVAVSSHVGTVTTAWAHGLTAGQSVTIADSIDAGIGGTFTISAITAPDQFTISMPSAANGVYCLTSAVAPDPNGSPAWTCATKNISHLQTPSGIGVSLIRSASRESGLFAYYELDHLVLFNDNNPPLPFTFVDATGTYDSRIHDIQLQGNPGGTASFDGGQIGLVCADYTPSNVATACFFDHFYDITTQGPIQTLLHWSAHGGNAGAQLIERFSGSAKVLIDTTSTLAPLGSFLAEWYISSNNDANSWDIYPAAPIESVLVHVSCELCTNHTPWNVNLFSVASPSTLVFTDTGAIRSSGGLTLNMQGVSTTYDVQPYDSTVYCSAAGANVNLPATPVTYPGGGAGGQIVTFRAWATHIGGGGGPGASCVISGNGNTIEGASTYTLSPNQTVTMQWFNYPPYSQWMIISEPGQLSMYTVSTLPTCGSAQAGLMYAVSDASSPSYNGTLTGGGSTQIPVFCNGSAWTAH